MFFELTSFIIVKHLGRIDSHSSQTSRENQSLLKAGYAKVNNNKQFYIK